MMIKQFADDNPDISFGDESVKSQLKLAFDYYIDVYFIKRDLKKTLAVLDEEICGFGTGADEIALTNQAMKNLYIRDITQVSVPIDVCIIEIKIDVLSNDIGTISSVLSVKTEIKQGEFEYTNLRLSLIFRKKKNIWLICHTHISLPTILQEAGESFPFKELEKRNQWLEEKIREKTTELVEANENLQIDIQKRKETEKKLQISEIHLNELNASKDKFFSIIAHDLKNPLGSFRNVTELLADSYEIFTEIERMNFLNLLKESSKNIYKLLENLLDWSRSQRGQIVFNPIQFDFNKIVQNIIQLLNHSAKDKSISLVNLIERDFEIIADPNLITTIIRNLLSNSIKFTSDYGKVEIGVLTTQTDDNIQIYVKDSGVGMREETINQLFRIDVHITSEGTKNEKGTGLGLILCKEFVEKHNGKIWVESEVGKGSTFWFSLPKEIKSV